MALVVKVKLGVKLFVKGQTFLIEEYLKRYGLRWDVEERCWIGEFSRLKGARIKCRIDELVTKHRIKVWCEIEG